MSDDLPATRASDSEREHVVARLRDASADGRLTVDELSSRVADAYAARTRAELDALVHDLPDAVGSTTRRGLTRLLFSLFGSTEREGSLRVRDRVICVTGFGNIDLDLRQANLEGDVIAIVAAGAFGAIDVYVPEGIEVDLRGFSLFGHARANGNEPAPHPGTPLVRVTAVSVWAGIDVWRVPREWTERTWREVIRGIRSGEHKQLGA